MVQPSAFIYMGRDKFENEELIRYGLPEDIWYILFRVKDLKKYYLSVFRFHVDDLSSAHVYLRLPEV